MMKFFRKYTKTLLAVFMALLLVVWLGGEALRNLFNRERDFSNEVVAKAFGEDVKQKDLARISNLSDIGNSLVRGWSVPWAPLVAQMAQGDQQAFQGMMMNSRREPLGLEEWYLLDTEASLKGVHVSPEAVNQYRANIPAEQLTAVRDRQKLSLAQMDQAIAAFLRIQEAAMQASDAVAVSEGDIQDFIRQVFEKIKLNIVIVDPAKLVDNTYMPPAEDIAKQFEKYKNKPAGGPGQYGYQLPEVTQVEYIEISADELAKAQTITDDEAFAYWSEHKSEFLRPSTQPAATRPATRPEEPKPYDTFTEAKRDVKKKLAHDKGAREASRLAEGLIRQLSQPWTDAPATQPGGYRQPPASATAPDLYQKTIAGIKSAQAAAAKYGKTPLADAGQLMSSPVGRASAFADTRQRAGFSEVAFMVNGSKTANKEADSEHARLYRNVFETCADPLTDEQGNVFVFRNIAVRPAQAPASVDEVRDKVITDLRHIRAYEQAETIAKNLADAARKSNLKAAFDADPISAKLKDAYVQPEAFARQRMFNMGGMPRLFENWLPNGIGRDKQLIDLGFSMASQSATQPAAPVAVHEQKEQQRWMVVEFSKYLPVTRDEYNRMREQARGYLLASRRLDFILNWFNHDEILARAGWQDTNPRRAKDESKPKQAKADM